MKRRWSNHGGFALRMLEESSSEVTSSSAGLVMSPSIALSPNSLGSPDYGELDLWGYDDNPMHGSHGTGSIGHHHHQQNGGLGGGAAINLNGLHSNLHGTNGTQGSINNHHGMHGMNNNNTNGHHGGTTVAAAALMNGVDATHISRLTQGMVNDLLAANGGKGVVGLGSGSNGLMNGVHLPSSRSSTSPSIGKFAIFKITYMYREKGSKFSFIFRFMPLKVQ